MKEKIEEIRKQAKESLEKVADLKALDEIRVKYLGKKGELTALLRGMGALPAEQRPIIGNLVNEVRDSIENFIEEVESDDGYNSCFMGKMGRISQGFL